MKIGRLATVEAHETGMEFRYIDPATGEKEDAVFTVLGIDSKTWRSAQKEFRRNAENVDDMLDHDVLWPMVAKILIGWENISGEDGTPYEYTIENCEWLCQNSVSLVMQIFSFIIDRKNFIAD
jgi:hypothetical protein